MGRNKQKAVVSKRDTVATTANQQQSQRRNDEYYWLWYDNLYQLASATINWEGMPVEIDKRFVNMALFGSGLVVFYWDEDYDRYFCLRGVPSGTIDMYNNPMGFTAYGAGNYHKHLRASECVPIWLNYRRVGMLPVIDLYARRLANFDRTIDVNLAQHKTPALIECDETQRLTVENAVKQVYEGVPVVFGNTGVAQLLQAHYLTNDAEYLVDRLNQDKLACLHEFLTLIGIDNSPVDKMTRVQSAEVMSNNEEIEMFRLVRFDTIREGCAAINRMYGTPDGNRPAVTLWADFNGDWSSENWATLNTIEDDGEGADDDGLSH